MREFPKRDLPILERGEGPDMRQGEREEMRRKLDAEQRWFRLAGQKTPAREGWLREIRTAVGIPTPELAKRLGINRSEIFHAEDREEAKTISLATLERQAEAMECRLVYAVIPKKGTFEDLSLKRAWDGLFGKDGEKRFKELLRKSKRT
jgi:predicted DNA-binding mobile mystery protein A